MDHEKWLKQHDEMMADHEIWMQNMRKGAEAAQKRADRTDKRLDRAIRLAVQDARRQRTRNAEFDEKMTKIASAQLINEAIAQGVPGARRERKALKTRT
jgi:hypothetical protein